MTAVDEVINAEPIWQFESKQSWRNPAYGWRLAEVENMALTITDEWITSDQCPQVAMAIPRGWVLSWRPGRYDREQAITAMAQAEDGDLLTDPCDAVPKC